ncbi:hypothetical protein ACFZCP_14540 [Streptomyces sp. NPDC007971]|uniref:hypothetical protein n=1 Tax=Streptomyces sp. NPDC007971 TaxID=3364799 RepID=UPI0036ECBD7A
MATPADLSNPTLVKEYVLGSTDEAIAAKYGLDADEVARRRHAIGLHKVSPQ